MSFEVKPYYRKMARENPEAFKRLIRRNERALQEYLEMYTERIEVLKAILKEAQDGISQTHEEGNGHR